MKKCDHESYLDYIQLYFMWETWEHFFLPYGFDRQYSKICFFSYIIHMFFSSFFVLTMVNLNSLKLGWYFLFFFNFVKYPCRQEWIYIYSIFLILYGWLMFKIIFFLFFWQRWLYQWAGMLNWDLIKLIQLIALYFGRRHQSLYKQM